MIERKDFDDYLERKSKEFEERQAKRSEVTYARQMRVEEAQLTSDPKWDKFLSYLQPLLNDAEKVLDNCKHNLMAPNLTPDGVLVSRMTGAYAQGRIEALKEVMSLPKQLTGEPAAAPTVLTGDNGHA